MYGQSKSPRVFFNRAQTASKQNASELQLNAGDGQYVVAYTLKPHKQAQPDILNPPPGMKKHLWKSCGVTFIPYSPFGSSSKTIQFFSLLYYKKTMPNILNYMVRSLKMHQLPIKKRFLMFPFVLLSRYITLYRTVTAILHQ